MCDSSSRTVYNDDLVKFFWVAMYSKKKTGNSIICKYNVTLVMAKLTGLQINVDTTLFSDWQFDSFFDTTHNVIGVTHESS